ncbi:MAG: cytidine deaminase [PVC group bacterium]
MITEKERDELLRRAGEARKHAHAPYSRYLVGATVLTAKGNYFSGCNVENAAFTITTHAEGNALGAAVAAGETEFTALLVLTDGSPPPFPCAICRQSLAEFDRGEMLILAANTGGEIREIRFSELYPEMFGPHKLGI